MNKENNSKANHRASLLNYLKLITVVYVIEIAFLVFFGDENFDSANFLQALSKASLITLAIALLAWFILIRPMTSGAKPNLTEESDIKGILRNMAPIYVLLFLLTASLLTGYYLSETSSHLDQLKEKGQSQVTLHDKILNKEIGAILSDIQHFAEMINQDSSDHRTLTNRRELIHYFLSFLNHKPRYDQVRLLDARGMELVRVNQGDYYNKPQAVPEDQMQDKSHREYFLETSKLPKGAIYISAFDLNQEKGKVEIPHKPTIRFASPIRNEEGELLGILVINYRGAVLLDELERSDQKANHQVLLLNQRGYWLMHPDKSKTFSFMFETKNQLSFAEEFPEAWNRIQEGKERMFLTEEGLFTVSSFSPMEVYLQTPSSMNLSVEMLTQLSESKKNLWHLVSYTPRMVIADFNKKILKNTLFNAAAALVTLTLAFYVLLLNRLKSHQATEALQRAKDEAEQAAKAKSEFLANMSHEIRTPMNSVLGFTELLDSTVQDPKQKGYLEAIKNGGKSLLTLINDILDLSKIESGRFNLQYESVNCYDMFEEIRQIFELRITQKQLKFIHHIAEDIPTHLILDEVRLRQVLFNLIGNAIKFTHEGFIKLTFKKEYTKADHSSLDLILTVEDSGIGIPVDQQEAIFEAFMQKEGQSNRQFGGTGLGLAISKRLVEMMNGRIQLESTPGQGTSFTITLSNVAVASSHSNPLPPPPSEKEGNLLFKRAKILVVDDILANRELLREVLTLKQLVVYEAADGKQAVEMAKQKKPELILMDLRMPIMDGYTATQTLKADKDTKYIPIVALTASVMKKEEEEMLTYGFNGYLRKPIHQKDLFYELAKYLETEESDANKPAEPGAIDLSRRELQRTAELITLLEEELLAEFNRADRDHDFDEIAQFARNLIGQGERHYFPYLTKLGKALLEETEKFNINQIEILMQKFHHLHSHLKTQALS